MNSTCEQSSKTPILRFLPLAPDGPGGAVGRRASDSQTVRNSPLECAGLLFAPSDVLFDETAWWRWVVQLLSRMGCPVHFRDLYCIWRTDYLNQVSCGRHEYWEAFRDLLRSTGLKPGQIDEVVLASRPKHRHFDDTVRPLPGVPSTLARLAATGMPMGVLCHGTDNCRWAADGLRRLGIGAYFSAILTWGRLGLRVPDRRAYRAAADAMQTAAGDMAFVGHDPVELAEAARAGMSTIAYNYAHDARADLYLERFDELCQRVRPRSSRRHAG